MTSLETHDEKNKDYLKTADTQDEQSVTTIEIYKGKESPETRMYITKADHDRLEWLDFDACCLILGLKSHDAVRERGYSENWRNKQVKEGRFLRRYWVRQDVEQSRKREIERVTGGVTPHTESTHGLTSPVDLRSYLPNLEVEMVKQLHPILEGYQKEIQRKDEKNTELQQSVLQLSKTAVKHQVLSKTLWVGLVLSITAIGLIFAFNVPNKFWREKETVTITKEVPVIKEKTVIKLVPVDKETYEDLKAKGMITKFETTQPENGSIKNGQVKSGTNGNGKVGNGATK